jgi:hypothetical protein
MRSPEEVLKLCDLAYHEGWEVETINDEIQIVVDTEVFPLMHPLELHLHLYRESTDPGVKLHSMHRAHDLLWPDHALTWNRWQEEMFAAHCEGYKTVSVAGGAGIGKSVTWAKIALIFWLSDPGANTVLVASTTLTANEARIWGYVAKLFDKAQRVLPISGQYFRSKPPKIKLEGQNDEIHGLYAIAVPAGADEDTIKNVIGRHPDKRLLVILDESTDMDPAIAKGIPNLERGVIFFQLVAIGNSNSIYDLHGSLATPRDGWDSISCEVDRIWATTQMNGVAIYFHPKESPAIHETDPIKKKALGTFLLTKEQYEEMGRKYTTGSDAYYRFGLGFWKKHSIDSVAISEQFLSENDVQRISEWAGYLPLHTTGGLDPAFQLGGIGCVLQFAQWGQTTDGRLVLDYRRENLLYNLDVKADQGKSGELQIAEMVVRHCIQHGCRIEDLAIDATGVGRALGELIRIVYERQTGAASEAPYRIISSRPKKKDGKTDPHVIVLGASDMWLTFREFVQVGGIRGLPDKTVQQMKSRQIKEKNGKLILETKEEYKNRMTAINPALAHSPDESDAAILCLMACTLRYGFYPGQRVTLPVGTTTAGMEKMMIAARLAKREAEEMGVGGTVVVGQGTMSRPSRPRLIPNCSVSLEEAASVLSPNVKRY